MGRNRRLIAAVILLSPVLTGTLSAEAVHVLRRGETLYSLSRKYGVSVDDMLRANGIADPSGLSVGMELVIPGEDGDGSRGVRTVEYTVAKGDTYYGIARAHGISVDELMRLNGRSADNVLRIGEKLVVSGTTGVNRPRTGTDSGTVQPSPTPVSVTRNTAPQRVSDVPRWPVAGWKAPLDGKLVGVAIEAEPLSYVHAVAAGNVVWTGPYRGFGHVVLVDSNGYIYLYGGNEDLFVNVGQNVAAGSRIGRLAGPGPDGGKEEMIFSVFREGVPVSPDDAPRG